MKPSSNICATNGGYEVSMDDTYFWRSKHGFVDPIVTFDGAVKKCPVCAKVLREIDVEDVVELLALPLVDDVQ